MKILDNNCSRKEILHWINHQLFIYIVGTASYYFIWQIILTVTSTPLANYEGINSLSLNLHTILSATFDSYLSFINFFTDGNIRLLTPFIVINIVFLICALFIGIKALRNIQNKRNIPFVFIALLCIPLATYIWLFASNDTYYSMRMVQAMSLIYIFVGALAFKYAKLKDITSLNMFFKKLSFGSLPVFVLIAFVFNNCLNANVFYHYMQELNVHSYTTATELTTRIHLLDDGNIDQIAFIGALDDITEAKDEYSLLGSLLPIRHQTLLSSPTNIALYMGQALDFTLTYYINNPDAEMRIITFSNDIASKEFTFAFPLCDEETVEELKMMDKVKNMGNWPANDALKVIDGHIIVVKLSDY